MSTVSYKTRSNRKLATRKKFVEENLKVFCTKADPEEP